MNINSLYSRNWLFISKKQQKKLKTTKILICGTGLGSVIAEVLLRTGIQNITIADGDCVELSNLNRQNFITKDIKINKAVALQKRLNEICPSAKITVVSKFLNKNDLVQLIPTSDIVVNTIDFDSSAFIECNNLCHKYKKHELFPTNLGFGGSVIFSPPKSQKIGDFFHEKNKNLLKMKIISHVLSKCSPKMKTWLKKYKSSNIAYDPQLGISSFVTAALLATIVVRIITKDKTLKQFPEFYHTELF